MHDGLTIKRYVRPLATPALMLATRPHRRRALARAARDAGSSPLRLNIGAGRHRIPGWINTDIHWGAQSHLDLLRPWPREVDGKVGWVYADNVIEHFSIEDVAVVLENAYRSMTPGGVIRLATPDVEAAAKAYLEDSDLAKEHLHRHKESGYTVRYTVDLLRIIFAESGHHLGFCFDEYSLQSELERVGFVNIKRTAVGESEHPELVGLETRSSYPSDARMALVLEATKRA